MVQRPRPPTTHCPAPAAPLTISTRPPRSLPMSSPSFRLVQGHPMALPSSWGPGAWTGTRPWPRGFPAGRPAPCCVDPCSATDRQAGEGRAGQGRAGGPSRHAAKARDWPPIAFTRTRTVARRKRNWREKRRKKAFVIDHTRIKCIWRRGHNAAPRPTKMKRSRDRGISANATNTRGTLANAWEAGNNSPLPRLAPGLRPG